MYVENNPNPPRLAVIRACLSPLRLIFRAAKMVKLGNNFSDKNNGKVVSEDGFDTIPLITPLDASQLQFPPPDKVRFVILYFSIGEVTVRGSFSCISIIPISPIKMITMKENTFMLCNQWLFLHVCYFL